MCIRDRERIYELTINLKLFTRLLPHPIQVAHLLLDMYNYNCSRYNCSCPQVINILFAIYKHTYYLIYFQMIAVGCTDHDVICIFHDLVYTDHAVVCRIIQHANKNSYATGQEFI